MEALKVAQEESTVAAMAGTMAAASGAKLEAEMEAEMEAALEKAEATEAAMVVVARVAQMVVETMAKVACVSGSLSFRSTGARVNFLAQLGVPFNNAWAKQVI